MGAVRKRSYQRPHRTRPAAIDTAPIVRANGAVGRSGAISRHVDAAPDAVFAFVTDPHRLPEWNAGILRVVDAPPTLERGSEWVVEFRAGALRWRSRATAEEVDRTARHFAYRSRIVEAERRSQTGPA